MNRKLIYKVLIAAIIFAACKKPLDLLPSDVIIDESAFRDVASLESGIIGAYATFNGSYDNDIYAECSFILMKLHCLPRIPPAEENCLQMAERW